MMDYEWTVHRRPQRRGGWRNIQAVETYSLENHDLPLGYSYKIFIMADRQIACRSIPGSPGGTRWYYWCNDKPENLWAAMDHGFAWARRKAKENRKGNLAIEKTKFHGNRL